MRENIQNEYIRIADISKLCTIRFKRAIHQRGES